MLGFILIKYMIKILIFKNFIYSRLVRYMKRKLYCSVIRVEFKMFIGVVNRNRKNG